MNRNEMRKIAKQIFENENICTNASVSEAERKQAQNNIIKLTEKIAALPNGLSIMLEVDVMIQQMANFKNKGD